MNSIISDLTIFDILERIGYKLHKTSPTTCILYNITKSDTSIIEKKCNQKNIFSQSFYPASGRNFIIINIERKLKIWKRLSLTELEQFIKFSLLPIPKVACHSTEIFNYKFVQLNTLWDHFSQVVIKHNSEIKSISKIDTDTKSIPKSIDVNISSKTSINIGTPKEKLKYHDLHNRPSCLINSFLTLKYYANKIHSINVLTYIDNIKTEMTTYLFQHSIWNTFLKDEKDNNMNSFKLNPNTSRSSSIYNINTTTVGISIDMKSANFNILRILSKKYSKDQFLVPETWYKFVDKFTKNSINSNSNTHDFLKYAKVFRHHVVNSLGVKILLREQK